MGQRQRGRGANARKPIEHALDRSRASFGLFDISMRRTPRPKTPGRGRAPFAPSNEGLRDARLVGMCNHVLASAGLVATVKTTSDVKAVCASTSVLIAAYEAVVGEKIPGVTRRPANEAERAANVRA